MKQWKRRKQQGTTIAPMPLKAPRTLVKPSPYARCAEHGCAVLTAHGRCSAHPITPPQRLSIRQVEALAAEKVAAR